MAATGTDDDLPPAPGFRRTRLGVRISPLNYEWHDNEEPDVCYWTNLWGVLFVQPRHLESSRMSTWN